MGWVLTIAILVAIAILLEREIYFYEGVHLGPRLQAWLYDHWSRQYDAGKRASQLHDDEMLAQPLLEALGNLPCPLILDFATGTGRLSYTLLRRPDFKGRIVALDLSQGMLEQAAAKLSAVDQHVEFLRHLSLPLPFPDASFDAVCALEVLELFPRMDVPLRELGRVLRPGGILLTSRGTEESGRRARVKSVKEFTSLLEAHGLRQTQITRWWQLFDRVIAVKEGASSPVAAGSLWDVLRCLSCGRICWTTSARARQCGHCGRQLLITEQGIVLN